MGEGCAAPGSLLGEQGGMARWAIHFVGTCSFTRFWWLTGTVTPQYWCNKIKQHTGPLLTWPVTMCLCVGWASTPFPLLLLLGRQPRIQEFHYHVRAQWSRDSAFGCLTWIVSRVFSPIEKKRWAYLFFFLSLGEKPQVGARPVERL